MKLLWKRIEICNNFRSKYCRSSKLFTFKFNIWLEEFWLLHICFKFTISSLSTQRITQFKSSFTKELTQKNETMLLQYKSEWYFFLSDVVTPVLMFSFSSSFSLLYLTYVFVLAIEHLYRMHDWKRTTFPCDISNYTLSYLR